MTSTLSDKREHVIPCIGLSRSPFWSRAASAASSVRVRSMRRMSDGRRCRWTFDHRRWGRFSGGQPRRHRSLVDALPKTPTMIGFDAKSSKTWDSSTDRPHTLIYHILMYVVGQSMSLKSYSAYLLTWKRLQMLTNSFCSRHNEKCGLWSTEE